MTGLTSTKPLSSEPNKEPQQLPGHTPSGCPLCPQVLQSIRLPNGVLPTGTTRARRGFERLLRAEIRVLPAAEAAIPAQRPQSEENKAIALAGALGELLLFNLYGSDKRSQFEACDDTAQVKLQQLYQARYASFAPGTLQGALSSWKRWNRWAQANKVPSLPAPAAFLALFLQAVGTGDEQTSRKSKGGPRAKADREPSQQREVD